MLSSALYYFTFYTFHLDSVVSKSKIEVSLKPFIKETIHYYHKSCLLLQHLNAIILIFSAIFLARYHDISMFSLLLPL